MGSCAPEVMVKQEEDEWGVFGKKSVERYSFYGAIEAIVVSCIEVAMLKSRSRMIEDQGYKQTVNFTDSVHLFQPHVSLIPLPVTAFESGDSSQSINENKV